MQEVYHYLFLCRVFEAVLEQADDKALWHNKMSSWRDTSQEQLGTSNSRVQQHTSASLPADCAAGFQYSRDAQDSSAAPADGDGHPKVQAPSCSSAAPAPTKPAQHVLHRACHVHASLGQWLWHRHDIVPYKLSHLSVTCQCQEKTKLTNKQPNKNQTKKPPKRLTKSKNKTKPKKPTKTKPKKKKSPSVNGSTPERNLVTCGLVCLCDRGL